MSKRTAKQVPARGRTTKRKSVGPVVMRLNQWADTIRGFEAAKTTRLNRAHWKDARGVDVNADLHADLPTLVARCKHEGKNNPHMVGVCKILAAHTIGRSGPILRFNSSSKAFNTKAQRLLKNWMAVAGADGRNLAHHLRAAVRRLPLTGELLWQIANEDASPDSPVTARVNPLNPKYLQTPTGRTESPTMRLGIEFPANSRRPRLYNYKQFEDGVSTSEKWVTFKPENIIHWFESDEEGQVRGVPWIASSLQGAADLRDMSGSVLRAADAAAMLAVLLWTQNGDANPVTLNSNTDIEPKSMMALPPGYQATQINPAQPSQNYEAFHRGKVAEQALPVGMPHVVAALDSSDTSYAGGRIDLQNYGTLVGVLQGELECAVLDRLVEMVLREAKLAGALPNAPEDADWSWVWPTIPHVDNVKQAMGQRMRIQDGTLDVVDACAEYGQDAEVIAIRRKAYQQQQDSDNLERIVAISLKLAELKKANPELDVNWAQVITALGAVSAPGAYLQAAAASGIQSGQSGSGDTSNEDDPSQDEPPTAQRSGRGAPRKVARRG